MYRPPWHKAIANLFIFALVFCLASRPGLHAAGPANALSNAPSLAENLFIQARDLSRALHARPVEERSLDEYLRALDAFGQVIRLNTDKRFSAESHTRRAELYREMADATGDSALYHRAIESYRAVMSDHANSSFVGDALINIAQIYEESLQDLEGAARAYREMIEHFPNSVLAREARAVLARFEDELNERPPDVPASTGAPVRGIELAAITQLTNVRNFTSPDYARVVIDLSGEAQYRERREGQNRLVLELSGILISPSLFGRRFIVRETDLLKRIVISEGDASQRSARVEVEVASLANYSLTSLSGPDRIIIDIQAGSVARPIVRDFIARDGRDESLAASENASAPEMTTDRARGESHSPRPVPQRAARNMGGAILSLPEIGEPIVPMTQEEARKAAGAAESLASSLATGLDQKASEGPIRRIVIDPGHGGHDTGTISPTGLREKDLVLDVARRLRNYIKSKYPEIEVIMTRDSDRFIALEERTAIANSRKADLFISVHANAAPSRAASGVETFFVNPDRAKQEATEAVARETGAQQSATPASATSAAGGASNTEQAKVESAPAKSQSVVASVTVGNRVAESRELARYIQSGLVRGIGAHSPRAAANRGVKHASFTVLVGAMMPSVLAEVSFLSNERDEALLKTGEFRERIAASLFAGLNAYLKRNRN
jgi:N-acetylmuramoyl-L-alanine amidase